MVKNPCLDNSQHSTHHTRADTQHTDTMVRCDDGGHHSQSCLRVAASALLQRGSCTVAHSSYRYSFRPQQRQQKTADCNKVHQQLNLLLCLPAVALALLAAGAACDRLCRARKPQQECQHSSSCWLEMVAQVGREQTQNAVRWLRGNTAHTFFLQAQGRSGCAAASHITQHTDHLQAPVAAPLTAHACLAAFPQHKKQSRSSNC